MFRRAAASAGRLRCAECAPRPAGGVLGYCIGGFDLVGSRYGLPDVGVVGLGEMAAGIRDIMNACDLPVLIDGDHGHGEVKNVTHTIRTYERMRAAA